MNASLTASLSTCLSASIILASADAIRGQTVGPEYLVSETIPGRASDSNLEPAIGAVRNSTTGLDEVMVGWNVVIAQTRQPMHYRISSASAAGFLSAALPRPIPVPCGVSGAGFDPMVTASPSTRDMWIGGIADATRRPFMAKKACASASLGSPIDVTGCNPSIFNLDKPFSVVGPIPGATDNTERMYTAYTFLVSPLALFNASSGVTPSVGQNWVSSIPRIQTASDNAIGKGVSLGVIPRVSGAPVGRLLASYSLKDSQFSPPEWTRTDNGGGSWDASNQIAHFTLPTPGAIDLHGGPFASNISVSTWPSIAIDPADPRFVYIVFAGHPEGESADETELFVAVSTNFGTSFDRVHRLTSAQLRMPGDPGGIRREFMPSAVIDRNHGINILFVRTGGVMNNLASVVIRYARFTSDAALGSAPFLYNLAGPFTPTTLSIGKHSNDYHMICSTGCTMYVAYVRPDPADPIPNRPKVYTRRIQVPGPCIVDLNGDGVPDSDDIALFGNAYIASSPAADVNNDGVVTAADTSEFLTNYQP